ncbi:MAG: hypothetical protein RLY34_46 [Actinomycetota bacterium]|jgi:two-component sensor histidine kinase
MLPLDIRNLRADLGGKSFLDKRIYFALSPLYFFNSVLISRHSPGVENWLWLGLINLIALAICWAWIEICARLFFSNRKENPVPIYQVILFGLSLGSIKGLATAATAVAVGFESNLLDSINSRTLQTAFLGVMVVLGASAITAAQNRYQEERDLLIAERVQEITKSTEFRELSSEIIQDLKTFVSQAKTQLREQKEPASKVIMDIVEQGLRPLSHKLWERENNKFANYVPGELIRLALLNKRFFAAPTAGFYAVITIPPALFYNGVADAVLRTLLGALIIFTGFSIGGLIPARTLSSAIGVYVSTLVLTTFGIMTLSTALLGSLPIADPISISIAIFIWFVEVTLVLGIARVMRENHLEVRRELLRLLGSEGIKSDVRASSNLLLNREFANYLHGSIQNQLISSALRIERLGNDPKELLRELAEVERLLDSAGTFSRVTQTGSLFEQLNDLKYNWAGFVEITIDVPIGNLNLPPILGRQLAQVANEAISNAVRHGHAKAAHISILQTTNQVQISVVDDGLGPVKKKAGLGSKFFDSVAPGGWQLAAGSAGGAVFTLVFEAK